MTKQVIAKTSYIGVSRYNKADASASDPEASSSDLSDCLASWSATRSRRSNAQRGGSCGLLSKDLLGHTTSMHDFFVFMSTLSFGGRKGASETPSQRGAQEPRKPHKIGQAFVVIIAF